MKFRNVWNDVEHPLELHTDDRGKIADLFYNNQLFLFFFK